MALNPHSSLYPELSPISLSYCNTPTPTVLNKVFHTILTSIRIIFFCNIIQSWASCNLAFSLHHQTFFPFFLHLPFPLLFLFLWLGYSRLRLNAVSHLNYWQDGVNSHLDLASSFLCSRSHLSLSVAITEWIFQLLSSTWKWDNHNHPQAAGRIKKITYVKLFVYWKMLYKYIFKTKEKKRGPDEVLKLLKCSD